MAPCLPNARMSPAGLSVYLKSWPFPEIFAQTTGKIYKPPIFNTLFNCTPVFFINFSVILGDFFDIFYNGNKKNITFLKNRG